MTPPPFVPEDFQPPLRYEVGGFLLEPLGPEHNEADHAAWMGSIPHIHATPGFDDWTWPTAMSLEDNLRDLESHARDFELRQGFTYTVLDRTDRTDGSVLGCLYIYPARANVPDDAGASGSDGRGAPIPGHASVRSWVRADRAELDKPLWEAVTDWLEEAWPFEAVSYAPRA